MVLEKGCRERCSCWTELHAQLIVRRWLQPAIPTDNIEDQYAYKNTGSTTAALVHFVHRVTEMLEHNAYVRCLMIDFSKAFDSC